LKNNQSNYKNELQHYLRDSIENLSVKVEKETREQKEYVISLHQDIDETIKRVKRDKSDNYLEMQKLAHKLEIVEETTEKTEDGLLKSASAYMQVLENIKMHLHILKQKDKYEIELRQEEYNLRPYVAVEGDVLNTLKPNNKSTTEDPFTNNGIHGLDDQLSKLDRILTDNNRLIEGQLKTDFNRYEEKNKMLTSIQSKSKLASPSRMNRLKSAK
jgi:hypothetical protein